MKLTILLGEKKHSFLNVKYVCFYRSSVTYPKDEEGSW